MPKTHGYWHKHWYNSYKCMMERCYRKGAENYPIYGGRGIAVCEEWHNIENFKIWAESSGHFDGSTLDRVDAEKDYSPDNCRWATAKEQANNRRNTVYLELGGERHTVSDWAVITGIKRSTLANRLCRGWSHERALVNKDFREGANKHA